MKSIEYFSMAALVVMGAIFAGCVKEEPAQPEEMTDVVDPVAEDNKVVCTTTVRLGETKALTPEGVKTFAEGDQVALSYHKNDGTDEWSAVHADDTYNSSYSYKFEGD